MNCNNQLLISLCCLLLIACSPKPDVFTDPIIEKDGISYSYQPMTGVYYSYATENGRFLIEQNFKNGRKHGISKEYFKNGQLRDSLNYKNGMPDGVLNAYNSNGDLLTRRRYKNGLLTGFSEWYEDRELIQRMNYKDNKPNGLSEHYDDGKLISKALYRDGKLVEQMVDQTDDVHDRDK